jgi:hypothetical protein
MAARRKPFDQLAPCDKKNVDGAALLDAVTAVLKRHLVLPPGAAEMVALWVAFSHTIDAPQHEHNPRLLFESPVHGCGKTRALGMVKEMMQRPLMSSGISNASIYRAIDEHNCALLIDEADTQVSKNEEVKGILNSGHDRAGAVIVRQIPNKETGEHKTGIFSTWSPIVVGWNAEHVRVWKPLRSRSLIVAMKRKRNDEHVERLRPSDIDQLHVLGSRAVGWALNVVQLLPEDPPIPPTLNNRDADNWRPLFAVADAVGGEWAVRARNAALLMTTRARKTSEIGVELLRDIEYIFDHSNGADAMHSDTMCSKLNEFEDRPWPTYERGRQLSQGGLAALLEPFDIKPRMMRIGPVNRRGYELAFFEDAFARYLSGSPSQPATPQQASDPAVFRKTGAATGGATIS